MGAEVCIRSRGVFVTYSEDFFFVWLNPGVFNLDIKILLKYCVSNKD